jgi:hypothetical protein
MFENKQINIINDDIMNYKSRDLSYVMFFEVLDNMPHDKVVFDKETKEYKKYSKVDLNTMEEVFEEIDKDQCVKKCL